MFLVSTTGITTTITWTTTTLAQSWTPPPTTTQECHRQYTRTMEWSESQELKVTPTPGRKTWITWTRKLWHIIPTTQQQQQRIARIISIIPSSPNTRVAAVGDHTRRGRTTSSPHGWPILPTTRHTQRTRRRMVVIMAINRTRRSSRGIWVAFRTLWALRITTTTTTTTTTTIIIITGIHTAIELYCLRHCILTTAMNLIGGLEANVFGRQKEGEGEGEEWCEFFMSFSYSHKILKFWIIARVYFKSRPFSIYEAILQLWRALRNRPFPSIYNINTIPASSLKS